MFSDGPYISAQSGVTPYFTLYALYQILLIHLSNVLCRLRAPGFHLPTRETDAIRTRTITLSRVYRMGYLFTHAIDITGKCTHERTHARARGCWLAAGFVCIDRVEFWAPAVMPSDSGQGRGNPRAFSFPRVLKTKLYFL